MVKYNKGDLASLKKTHACGGKEWEVLRAGTDFKLKCMKCGHIILIDYNKFIKMSQKQK